MNDRPVILSYFAQSPDNLHLPMLGEEQNAIQLAWEAATYRPQNPIEVDYLARDSGLSKQDQIIKDIKEYSNRIVLFQFSGHAGPNALQLNDGMGGPDGIAGLLEAHAPNLKVVVLNGCSTGGQVKTLFERGIRAVVATSRTVKDTHAKQFAISFHQTLCAGYSIQEAYRDAILALKAKKLDRLLPQDIRESAVSRSGLDTSVDDGLLWGLFTQDTAADSVNSKSWWAISGRPDANQPPANFYEANQYGKLKKQLDQLNNDYAKARVRAIKFPDETDFQEELMDKNQRRQEIQKEIDGLKDAIQKLADEFTRIPLNTERLRLAKAHFDAGEYEGARAIFDTEIELMETELAALLEEKEKLAGATSENEQHLTDKANEYLILANLTAINFDLADRYEQTRAYFTLSLKAHRNPGSLFAYGYFLYEHNQFNESKPLFEEALGISRDLAKVNPQAYLPDVATTLNNLGLLFDKLNELGQAQSSYEEALGISRDLAKVNPQAYLPGVATTALNMSIFYYQTISDKPRSLAYARETLQAAKPFKDDLPVMDEYVSTALQIIKVWGEDPDDFL